MKRKKATVTVFTAFLLAVIMVMPMTALANADPGTIPAPPPAIAINSPTIRVENGEEFVPLRQVADFYGAQVQWDDENSVAIITGFDGQSHTINITDVGGFLEDGTAWVPLSFAINELDALLAMPIEELLAMRPVPIEEITWEALTPFAIPVAEPVDRIDPYLWEQENFEDVRDARFSTDLPHGVISVEYIRYMNDNLPARSAFTYRELETAVWIVEELLAMGHDWENIEVQEFTYWEVNDMEIGLMGGLHWGMVTSPGILGENREYQLREDRVSQNVVLTIPGESDQVIIVGAHYDSPPYPSASDNASGTALLLESAQRMLALDNYHTVVYVFFGAEEVGLIGAYYFLETLAQSQQDNIVMMVNADVLVEGPYIIYGAGALPEVTDALLEDLAEVLAESMVEILALEFDMVMEMLNELELTPQQAELPFNTLEEFLDLATEQLANMPPDVLFLQGVLLGLVDPEVDAVSQQVSALAAELSENNDFEFLSIVEAIHFPTDSLAFLFDGHRVVNFVGLERMDNITPELAAQMTRLGEGLGDLTVTILHSPLDDFDTIEAIWPGMMNANMEAFVMLLEAILTGIFS